MRSLLIYITLVLISLETFAQGSLQFDTIKITEVIISGKRMNVDKAGYKSISVDSVSQADYSHGSIAELMAENPSVFIKSYGNGGSATPSFRGTGAGNTQVTWNGIRIDHPMLGQSDLSLLPAGMTDGIHIYFGGASMSISSGGTGGLISLESRPDWNKETRLILNSGAGSYGRLSSLLTVRTGTKVFQSVTKAFIQGAENNFRYFDNISGPVPLWSTRKNNEVSQKGFIQEVYLRKSDNVLSARLWYQSADRNLPASILSGEQGQKEKQYDESLRTMLNYENNGNEGTWFVTAAWMTSKLNYSNLLVSIDSRNYSDMWVLKTGFDRNIYGKAKLKMMITDEINTIRSNNYSENKGRNTGNISLSAESLNSGRLNGTLLIREIIDAGKLLLPDFSSSVQFRITEMKDYFLKANISRNSKIPSMNDLHWLPGGNPDLKNEYSFIYEVGLTMDEKISTATGLKYNLSLYKNSIKDMIQWHPGEFAYWTADNIRSVNSMGLESDIAVDYTINRFETLLKAGYAYTRAFNAGGEEDGTEGKQLIYTPENQFNSTVRLKYGKVYCSWKSNATGKRYTTADNSQYLPAFFVNNISTGIRYMTGWGVADLSLDVENVFNTRYETMAYFPLPGRSYFLKLFIQINKP